MQEVFLKLWDQRQQLDQIKQLEGWCIRLTRNKAYDKLRLHGNKTVELKLASGLATREEIPDKNTENKDLLEAIQAILQLLPEKQREIFRLKDLLGYSNAEIQEILDLNASQVKVNLFRARRKIKSKLILLENYGLKNEKTSS